jgi:hypothetical protein
MAHKIGHGNFFNDAILRRMVFTKNLMSLQQPLRGTRIIEFRVLEMGKAGVPVDLILSARR